MKSLRFIALAAGLVLCLGQSLTAQTVATTTTLAASLDGFLNKTVSSTLSLDARIRSAAELLTFSFDANIQGSSTARTTTCSLDASLFTWRSSSAQSIPTWVAAG